MTSAQENHEARTERAKQTAEVFTPPELVNDMLNKLPATVWEKGKTFCDPACGNGNFLIEVLKRKLAKKHDSLEALQSIYGVDIMKDNIGECRMRLLQVLFNAKITITKDHIKAVFNNIFWANPKVYPNGSLDYEFDFPKKYSDKNAESKLEKIRQGHAFEGLDFADYDPKVVRSGEVIYD